VAIALLLPAKIASALGDPAAVEKISPAYLQPGASALFRRRINRHLVPITPAILELAEILVNFEFAKCPALGETGGLFPTNETFPWLFADLTRAIRGKYDEDLAIICRYLLARRESTPAEYVNWPLPCHSGRWTPLATEIIETANRSTDASRSGEFALHGRFAFVVKRVPVIPMPIWPFLIRQVQSNDGE
jgi:hypothetical protein